MYRDKAISVVIPCYNEESQIGKVLETMPDYVDEIICVNDASTDNTLSTLEHLKENIGKLKIVNLEENEGVGGAIDAGYGCALQGKSDLIGVMAGDGQMDPDELAALIDVLLDEKASYSKITRLYQEKYLKEIPRIRRIGNSILSILTRISSGYWNMSDSQTGYTVITRDALSEIQGNLWKYYGFPNDVLNKLGLANRLIVEIPSKPIYGVGEVSKLKPTKVAIPIFGLLLRGIRTRIRTQFFIRTLHPIGIGYFFGFLGFLSGAFWLLEIFIWQFVFNHNTQPLQLLSALIFTQSALLILWLSLMFDALAHKDNSRLINK